MTLPEKTLRDALREPVSPGAHQALMSASTEAEAASGAARTGLRFRRISGRAMAVIAGVSVSGAVIAAAAIPFALDVLFPPPVSTSFTFESGVVCDIEIRVTPDFASSERPEAAMDLAQKFISRLDVAGLPVQQALDAAPDESSEETAAEKAAQAAREAAGVPEPTPFPYMAESRALSDTVMAAIRTELDSRGMPYGVSIETGTECR